MMSSLEHDHFVEVEGNPTPDGAMCVWFTSRSGLRLRACRVPSGNSNAARGTCIVCPGRTEFIEKYFEVARELQERGFAVLILDWPGQGRSQRLLQDPRRGHVDTFETFIAALEDALEQLAEHLPRPHVALAHSMGGAIALGALAGKRLRVDAAAFSAPMWGLARRPFGLRYLVWAMRALGRSGDYARPPGPPETFEGNIVTSDRARWSLQRTLVETAPDLAIGQVTWGWLGAALDIVDAFSGRMALKDITVPVLVASAAHEKLVDNASHVRLCARLPDCEHIVIEDALHEILMETDETRAKFWTAFDALMARAGV